MLDLDQRVTEGLRELAGRAPVDADVWAVTEQHVGRRRRRRHGIAGGVAVVALVAGALVSVVVVHGETKPGVSDPTATTVPVAVLPATGPVEGFFKINAALAGNLTFEPESLTVTTGIYAVELRGGSNSEHTLQFDDPATLSSPMSVSTLGDVRETRVFFGHAGDYTFFCAVPGHRQAGMNGVVHVTGPTLSLADALAAGR